MQKCSNLTKQEKWQLEEIISGRELLNCRTNACEYSLNVQNALRHYFNDYDYLTVAEYAVWARRSIQSVYRDIKKGLVITERTGGPGSRHRINMIKTKQNLKKTI